MKPAIFNTDMVRAILENRKNNTRRPFSKYIKKVIKYAYELGEIGSNGVDTPFSDGDIKYLLDFAPYKKGDIIYVRETFNDEGWEDQRRLIYKADVIQDKDFNTYWWKPSIHMPKEYARLFLRVKDVHIERLNEISEDDAIAEGIKQLGGGEISDTGDYFETYYYHGDLIDAPNDGWGYENTLFEWAGEAFASLWESIYGKDSFNDDYVWVIEFEKISKEEAIQNE